MIRSIGSTATRPFIESGKSKFRGLDERIAVRRLAQLDAAPSLEALSPLKSVDLPKLRKDRAGQWAMTINGPWRLVFRFENGDAYDVEIVDYH